MCNTYRFSQNHGALDIEVTCKKCPTRDDVIAKVLEMFPHADPATVVSQEHIQHRFDKFYRNGRFDFCIPFPWKPGLSAQAYDPKLCSRITKTGKALIKATLCMTEHDLIDRVLKHQHTLLLDDRELRCAIKIHRHIEKIWIGKKLGNHFLCVSIQGRASTSGACDIVKLTEDEIDCVALELKLKKG